MNHDNKIPFQNVDWKSIPKTEHKGETGTSYWQTVEFPGLRIRIVEYSKGYVADHWCKKGHIVHCLEGSFVSELENEKEVVMSEGNTYVVSDGMSSHRSIAFDGARLMIIDGEFLGIT